MLRSPPLPPDDTAPVVPKTPRGKIVLNPELVAMDQIYREIQALPESARGRVVSWINETFKTATEPAK